ncbi:hypothetical protein [Mariniphaga sediminis]
MDDRDKIIARLQKQLENANKTISALEQEVALLNNQNAYLKKARKDGQK